MITGTPHKLCISDFLSSSLATNIPSLDVSQHPKSLNCFRHSSHIVKLPSLLLQSNAKNKQDLCLHLLPSSPKGRKHTQSIFWRRLVTRSIDSKLTSNIHVFPQDGDCPVCGKPYHVTLRNVIVLFECVLLEFLNFKETGFFGC